METVFLWVLGLFSSSWHARRRVDTSLGVRECVLVVVAVVVSDDARWLEIRLSEREPVNLQTQVTIHIRCIKVSIHYSLQTTVLYREDGRIITWKKNFQLAIDSITQRCLARLLLESDIHRKDYCPHCADPHLAPSAPTQRAAVHAPLS
jgi:hypothetical protein